MRNAKQIFDEVLSGEPLSEDLVECAIRLAMSEAIKEAANVAKSYTFQPTVNGGKRAAVNKESILELLKKI